jgi:hypothetical protein
MASVECSSCFDALSHDHGGVRCTSDPPHHLCGDCSIVFCSFKLNELSADAFPPACRMCSEPVTLASFDAHLDAEQRTRFLQVSLTHALAESESTETIVRDDFVPQDGGEENEEEAWEEGRTELMGAAAHGDTENVVALLAAPGLDVNAADGVDSYTALMLAADGGHTETVTALLAAPGLDVNAAADDGSDPGHSTTLL